MDELIIAEGLKKVYETILPTIAVEDASFIFKEGEFAALIGESGSGKSTLLNLLGLLDTPTAGRVVLKGKETQKLTRKDRARVRNSWLGFVFQFHYLLPEFSVLENVLMPAKIAGKAGFEEVNFAQEVLALLGLEGLENKNANQLSGGQRQRVAIGRAIINRPSLILADEPTGNLDTANTDQVYELFRKINREYGTAFLIVTHERRIAQRTDRVLEISDGRLVQDVRNTYLEEIS